MRMISRISSANPEPSVRYSRLNIEKSMATRFPKMGRNWDESEDAVLKQMVVQYGKQWNIIATHFPNRTASQVAARWEKCLDPTITKGSFTPGEDAQIADFVAAHGPRNWPQITQILPHRSSKQCRECWFNHLNPTVTKTPWTAAEDALIFEQFKASGGKWSTIAKLLPGRTDNAIKNRFNSSISKRIQSDSNRAEVLLPDSSRRQYKQKSPRPPKIPAGGQPPPGSHIPDDPKKPPPLQIGIPASPGTIQFTPFSLPTPSFAAGDGGLFTPGIIATSPFELQSPKFDSQTPTTFGGLFSPFKTGDGETLK
jgi:hypothetical protein